MRIVIDARMYQESGIGRYIRNLLDNLKKLDERNEYFILHIKSDYDTLEYHNNFNKVLADFQWYGLTEQYQIPKILSKIKPDLVHFPHFNVPIVFGGKFVVTIHDLIHQHYSMQRATTHGALIYKIKQFGYKKIFQYALKKSEKILVPSNYVKDLLVKDWRVDERKIVVTHEAVDDKIQAIVGKMSTTKAAPYIFYVGNAHPHKNVEGLIEAFLLLRKKYQYLTLVLSGSDHYFWQRIKKGYQDKNIVYTGYVSDQELVALYKNASCFVMPSFEEGFGIPLLEAMVCSCPVVSSNAGALVEVGGNAAVYFDPHDLEDMADKVDRVLGDGKLRNKLIEKGHKRVNFFSWEKLAMQNLEVYEECV